MLKRILCLLILILASQAQAEPFRLIVLPDTQFNSEKWPEQVTAMTEWIVKNQQPLNIKYVLHVGDMVEHGNSEQEWKNFDASMQVLDGKVPYVLAVGNHDFDKIADTRSTVMFDKYFPPERFGKLPSYPTKDVDKANSYRTFSAAGINWLIVTMPFLPTDEQLEGANRVVKGHPEHRVIVLTHSYLTHAGRDKSGEYIWEKLVRRHGNISLVVCGHLSTVHFVSQGDQGNKVYEMLFDWQNDKKPEPNSYLAILEFDPDAAKLSVKSYSPTLDKYLTDPRGRFEFRDVDFLKAKAKATASGQATSNNPDVRTLLDQGKKAFDGGNFDEAIANYQKALAIRPNDAEAHDSLGLALLERGQAAEAIAHYRMALEIKPDYAEAHNNLGLALIKSGRIDEAIAHYRKALEIKPDLAAARNNLGSALAARGRVDEAIAEHNIATRQTTHPYVTLTGTDSHVKEPSYRRAMSEDAWIKIWQRHKGEKRSKDYDLFYNLLGLPYIDFENCMVIAVFQGSGWNSAGLKVVATLEEKDRIVLRFQNKWYQTAGPDGGGDQVTVYGFFVLPRSSKTVVLEENVQNDKGQPPVWKERASLSK